MSAATVIAAFSEDQVERLTGITTGQLRYWDRTRFFVPSYAAENRRSPYSRIYSFKDVASLRTISVLRNQHNVALQHLRKVAEKLRKLSDDGWTKTTLYVLGKRVVFHEPGTGKLQEVVGGQYVVPSVPLKTVFSDTRRDVEALGRRSSDKAGRIERSRYISHNAFVVSGTRIPVATIKRFAEDGYTVKQIMKEYPTLTEADIKAAIEHRDGTLAA